ncbi:hypothetical protein TRFO_33401 [Tritrichomonas foetus]|uniref:Uncharacterized protein n=1 Tax=Tritrichomonas foetus TaxID=1144522 RepID=A0A1J4JLQ5_9EUKA|nr:hypothetical protein TRFO_33401 [Tritrichomonas foetus]|eukprot:OHT00019.1 hypothetical protein TRFO_33401 [Tritrichomonas foetus]
MNTIINDDESFRIILCSPIEKNVKRVIVKKSMQIKRLEKLFNDQPRIFALKGKIVSIDTSMQNIVDGPNELIYSFPESCKSNLPKIMYFLKNDDIIRERANLILDKTLLNEYNRLSDLRYKKKDSIKPKSLYKNFSKKLNDHNINSHQNLFQTVIPDLPDDPSSNPLPISWNISNDNSKPQIQRQKNNDSFLYSNSQSPSLKL